MTKKEFVEKCKSMVEQSEVKKYLMQNAPHVLAQVAVLPKCTGAFVPFITERKYCMLFHRIFPGADYVLMGIDRCEVDGGEAYANFVGIVGFFSRESGIPVESVVTSAENN